MPVRTGRIVSLGSLCGLALWLLTGCGHREVLSPTPQMDAEARFWVRVLILDDVTQCRIEAPSSLKISSRLHSEPVQVSGTGREPRANPLEVTIQPGGLGVAGRIFEPGDEVEIVPSNPHVLWLDGMGFRGALHLVLDSEGRRFDVVNWVPLEPYVAGVVGAEMPPYWEPQALRAQAIAARTYCWALKDRPGPSRRPWDIRRTEGHQVYRGLAAESASVWNAVGDTTGMVLCAPGETGGQAVFRSYYSAICGGHTEDGVSVFGDLGRPLAAVECPFCEEAARKDQFCWPSVQVDRRRAIELLEQRYPGIKALNGVGQVEPSRQSTYQGFSRITQFRLVGSNGKAETLRAEDFRLVLDPSGRKIRSTCFRFSDAGDTWVFSEGRGWGHGVGMCQTGAQGMARRGWMAEDILQYYYPGSQVVGLY